MDYLQYSRGGYYVKFQWKSVLNLVINGLPSIQNLGEINKLATFIVLNLVINGLPSIP